MFRLLHLAIQFFLIAAIVLGASARADETIHLRAWAHDTFGRVVFDGEKPVTHSVTVIDGKLVIEFSRPMPTALDLISRRLGAYVENVTSEADGKRVILTLKSDFELRSFIDNGNAVVDLLDGKILPAPAPERIRVRTGEHSTFTRLVFDWQDRVVYRVTEKGKTAAIRFNRQASFDLGRLKKALPKYVNSLDVRGAGSATEVVLVHTPKARLRHFRDGPRVVVDLLRSAPKAVKKVAKKRQKPALTKRGVKSASSKPTPKPVALTPAPKMPIQLTQVPKSEVLVPVRSERNGNVISLAFDWDRPVGAAVFARAGYI